VHKQYSRQSLSFISGVASLLASLDSTPVKSHRNTSMDPLPVSLVSTPVGLHASPLYVGILSLLSPYSFSIFFSNLFHFFIFFHLHNFA